MKKFISVSLIITSFFVLSTAADAAYLIRLKNGGKLVTFKHWREGDQVKFYFYGAVVGIPADAIRSIGETDLVYEKPSASPVKKPEAASDKQEPATAVKGEETISPAPEAKGKEAVQGTGIREETASTSAMSAVEKKDDLFMKEFDGLKKRFEKIEMMTSGELDQLSKDLTAFRDKVHASRLGHVYANQIYEIVAMGQEVEAAIKTRGQ